MVKIKKLAVFGLIVNLLIMIVSAFCFGALLLQYSEGGFGIGGEDLEKLGEMSILLFAILGAALVMLFGTLLLFFLGSFLSLVMKICQLKTGKGGFAIPSLIFEGGLLMMEFLWLSASLSYGNYLTTAVFAAPFVLSLVSFLQNVKTLKIRGMILRGELDEA